MQKDRRERQERGGRLETGRTGIKWGSPQSPNSWTCSNRPQVAAEGGGGFLGGLDGLHDSPVLSSPFTCVTGDRVEF